MRIKKILTLLVASSIAFNSLQVSSQTTTATADPAYWNMQRAMGGILQQSAQARGYSTTDPRTYSTLYGVGKAATTTVAAAGAGLLIAGTAPAWGTFLAMTAVGSALGYGISLGIDKLVNWYFSPTNTSNPITTTKPTVAGAVQQTIPIVTAMPTINSIIASSVGQDYSFVLNSSGTYYQYNFISAVTSSPNPDPVKYGFARYSGTLNGTAYYAWQATSVKLNTPCPANYTQSGTSCTANGTTNPNGTTTIANQTLDQALAALTQAQKDQALSYDTMAYMLNELWKKAAAQPDYAGVPYSASNPITAAEVQAWAQANPDAYPTAGSLGAPITNPNNFYPSTTSSTSTPPTGASTVTPPTGTNAGQSSTPINLGIDPNIKAPTLEATPTAQQIIQPVSGLLPSFKTFSMPQQQGVCPTGSFAVFDQQYTLNAHCTLFEQNAPTLSAAMYFVWLLAALFIVLKA